MTSCIILAAGQGTRLRPYTDDRPKCLVELNDRPLIEYQLETMKRVGIKDITIITGFAHERIEVLGYPTIYNKNFKETNMVASLMAAKSKIEKIETDLIISYSDIVFNVGNISNLLSASSEIDVLTDDSWLDLWSLRNADPLRDAETIKFNNKNKIIEIGKKAKSFEEIESQFIGLIKIRRDKIMDFLEFYRNLDRSLLYDGQPFNKMYMTSLIELLIKDNWDIRATRINGGWLELDTVSDLELYNSLNDSGQLSRFWVHDA